jgi:Pyridoxamine 5'-phosphate oxidase
LVDKEMASNWGTVFFISVSATILIVGLILLLGVMKQQARNLTHLVTLNKDGSPQVSIVWVGIDGDEIVCAHLNLYQKLKDIQRDSRVALPMETGGKTNGLDNYLVINGRARITEGGARRIGKPTGPDLYRPRYKVRS